MHEPNPPCAVCVHNHTEVEVLSPVGFALKGGGVGWARNGYSGGKKV
jgi:hypothetical protein